MTVERSDVKLPMWRKKVDSSLFEDDGTVIPIWVCKTWNIKQDFVKTGRKIKQNEIKILQDVNETTPIEVTNAGAKVNKQVHMKIVELRNAGYSYKKIGEQHLKPDFNITLKDATVSKECRLHKEGSCLCLT